MLWWRNKCYLLPLVRYLLLMCSHKYYNVVVWTRFHDIITITWFVWNDATTGQNQTSNIIFHSTRSFVTETHWHNKKKTFSLVKALRLISLRIRSWFKRIHFKHSKISRLKYFQVKAIVSTNCTNSQASGKSSSLVIHTI